VGVLEVLKPLSRGWSLEIAGGVRWFSAIYVQDLVEGLIIAARHPAAPGQTYFLSHRKPLSWTQLANTAAYLMHRPLRVIRVPPAAARAFGWAAENWSRVTGKPGMISRDKIAEAQCAAWTCNPSRAARELGFEAGMPLEDGLAETLKWYKEAGWLRY
jgi:nucleoside-diphosphate-sugar epimerase